MSLVSEISSTLLAVKDVPQDLRDPVCKSLCDKLTSLMWKVLVNNLDEGDISQANYVSAMEKTYYFPHLGSRVYELAVFHGMKSNLIRGEDPSLALGKYDSMLDLSPPTKSNLLFKGCINYKASGIKEAQYYFLKGNQEYIEGSIVTSFFRTQEVFVHLMARILFGIFLFRKKRLNTIMAGGFLFRPIQNI